MPTVLRRPLRAEFRWPPVWVTIVCLTASAVPLRGAPPTLSQLVPAGVQRGVPTDITCLGEFDWPLSVWAPALDVDVSQTKGQLRITADKQLKADRSWIRLYNRQGASAAIPLLLGDVPETQEVEPNDAPQSAQQVAEHGLPLTVNGVLQKRGDVDGFAVQLERGQTLIAAVAAHHAVGSQMDAILQVTTPSGFVLQENHDDLGLDPRLAFAADATGTFVVRLFAFPSTPNQRIQFHGGKELVYRLTLTTGPYVTHAQPSCMDQDQLEAVMARGWNLRHPMAIGVGELDSRLRFEQLPANHPVSLSRFGLAETSGVPKFVRVALLPFPVRQAPARQQELLGLPAAISGRLSQPRQIDQYRLPLQQGQAVQVDVQSVSLGSRMVPRIQLLDPDGKRVAEFRETGAERDASLTHTAQRSGEYRLTVQDRYQHSGDRYFYRLIAQPLENDFQLQLSADAFQLTPGTPLEIPVAIHRTGGGKISLTLTADDLPPGVTCESVRCEDGAKKVTLKLQTDGTPFSGPLRIVGTSTEPPLRRGALTPARFGTSFDHVWLTVVDKN